MANSNEGMRDRLLSRLPQPETLTDYRNEVNALLDRNEKKLRMEKRYSAVFWVFVVGLCATLMWRSAGTAKAAELGCFGLFFLIAGAVELLKTFINRSRVELLKEIKQVQLQMLELQASLRKETA